MTKQMTLANHAEAWILEQGKEVPLQGTPEWKKMYEEWHTFAFAKGWEKASEPRSKRGRRN